MRVRIISGATTVDLATTGLLSPDGLTSSPGNLVQEVPLFRAPGIKVFNRGNFRNQFTFSITRVHASLQASELFFLEHAQSFPLSGRVEFVTDDNVVTRFMDPAVVRVTNAVPLGRSTVHAYQIIGGLIQTPPTP